MGAQFVPGLGSVHNLEWEIYCKDRKGGCMMWIGIVAAIFGFVGGMGLGGGMVPIPAPIMLSDCSRHGAQSAALLAFLPLPAAAIIIQLTAKRVKYKQAGVAV